MNAEEKSLWQSLRESEHPVVLYGTGNGADKILDALEKYGVEVSGVFASGGFVRDRYFRGFKVLSFSEAEEKFGDDFTVLLSFGTNLPEVYENIRSIAKKHPLYAPFVPLFGGDIVTEEYLAERADEIGEVLGLFEDERSKKLFSDILNFRLTGKLGYLADVESPEESYRSVLGDAGIKTAIDCGAYRGDSAADMISALSPEKVIAAEPDTRTYKKLCAFAESESRAEVIPINCAVGEKSGTVEFSATAGRSGSTNYVAHRAKTEEVPLTTVDEIAKDLGRVDLIKYDVEGDEWEALRGSLETVKRDGPCLAVSVYHRTDDLIKLPLYVHSLLPGAKLYLRRADCLPDWDIALFAKTK